MVTVSYSTRSGVKYNVVIVQSDQSYDASQQSAPAAGDDLCSRSTLLLPLQSPPQSGQSPSSSSPPLLYMLLMVQVVALTVFVFWTGWSLGLTYDEDDRAALVEFSR